MLRYTLSRDYSDYFITFKHTQICNQNPKKRIYSNLLEHLYQEQNKEFVEQKKILKIQALAIQKNIDNIEESYFIKKDNQQETYDKFLANTNYKY